MNQFNEENLVESPAVGILEKLGYESVNAFHEKFAGNFDLFDKKHPDLGRSAMNEVVLVHKLHEAIKKLNPDINNEAIELAVTELTKDRSVMSLVNANQEIYKLIKDGINVSFNNKDGDEEDVQVKIIDFDNPENNDFFAIQQFWVVGDLYKRRPDVICFVNGLPLIFIELKGAGEDVKKAFDDNLTDYKSTIPHLFWYNAFLMISNGNDSKIGTITSGYEHFSEWKKINSEGEKGVVSLETILKGVCEKNRLMDILENFILFSNQKNGLAKIIAKNHQYLGVNNTIEKLGKVREEKQKRGKLGVFWHTQGSGKSYSMIFFSQKVLRKFKGNFTFLVVTDRQELDRQIYTNFVNAGATKEAKEKVHASSIKHLRELLQKEDHRNIFTLIQKFQTQDDEEKFPVLSDRSDIIVMTDEAHRTQYDLLALNMRNALPHANFIGFTGTPLIEGEEQETKETFGDYVSIYNFRQSVEDGATKPLYYENRIPEVNLDKQALDEGLNNLLDNIELDHDQEKKLKREFEREYHIITRDDRLNRVAKDIIEHFNNRGNDGKAMLVCIDRLTAIKMYDKLKEQPNCPDVAIVFSSNQNEVDYFKKHGLDIIPHRTRMVREDLGEKFKDPNDPLRIVIVCAMWLTGFDVEVLSTIYLDKPMKNHTLMQTIARANRVFPGKNNGLIVDYIGVFRNLQKALSVYALDPRGDEVDVPVISKEALVEELKKVITEGEEFIKKYKVSIDEILKTEALERLKLINQAVDIFLISEEIKNEYLNISNKIIRIFGAILPDRLANEFFEKVKVYRIIANRIRVLTQKEVNVDEIADKIEKVLDEAIEADGYNIRESSQTDLSKINFEKLREVFDQSQKHTEAEKLKQAIQNKLNKLIKLNPTRLDLAEKLEKLIEEYNAGARNVEEFFKQLMDFAKTLNEEEKRAVKENLDEEHLAMFDLLYKDNLDEKEKTQIKKASKDIIEKLKEENLLCLDWRKKQQARAQVREVISDVLYEKLPDSYDNRLYQTKLELIFQHVYDSYIDEDKNVYVQIS